MESPFRLQYDECREVLRRRLAEPAPGRIQLVTGPRQVGKTTLLLEEAYLVAPLQKRSSQVARRRSAPPKLVPLSNALSAVTDPRGSPDPEREPDRFGAWVENACLAAAWNAGQQVSYWREEPLEVDGVIDGAWGRYAVEVKTGAFAARQLTGLLEFSRRFRRFSPLLLCDPRQLPAAERLGVPAMSWRDFLVHGPAGGTT